MDEVQLHLWASVEGGQLCTCGKLASNSHRSGDPSALIGQNLVAAPAPVPREFKQNAWMHHLLLAELPV